jgi:hypothetical protein
MLLNFRVDPEVMQRQLPAPFVPKLQGQWAVAGICLIRLEQIRPEFVPFAAGLSSENAAHRIAVRWKEVASNGSEGVYIPRRDSNSRLNHWVGGRLFPGEHHAAEFVVRDDQDAIEVAMRSTDSTVQLNVRARPTQTFPAESVFSSLEQASAFFEAGSLGYSATTRGDHFDGLRLATHQWRVHALEVGEVHSSYFEDPTRFPPGSVRFDCGLLMRDIEHSWESAANLAAKPAEPR